MSDPITDDQRDLVSEVREALAKATPAPWVGATPPDDSTETQAEYVRNTFSRPDAHASHCHAIWSPKASEERGGTIIIGFTGDGPTSYENRELIANAPSWLAALCEQVERLRWLVCSECGDGRGWISVPDPATGDEMQQRCEMCDWRARAEKAEAAVERVRALCNQPPRWQALDLNELPTSPVADLSRPRSHVQTRDVREALDGS